MGGRRKKAKVRGAFDFETWGWTPEEGEDEVQVHPLLVALAVPGQEGDPCQGGRRLLIPNKSRTEEEGRRVAQKALALMYELEDVDEWWAHFSHGFDTLHLVAAALRMGWRVQAAIAGQGPIAVDFQPPDRDPKFDRWLRVLDLFRVIPAKLATIAEDFHLPSRKLFTASDYAGDMRDVPFERLKEGCLRDVQLVLEALAQVEQLFESFGGELKTTFSSSALTCVKASLKERGIRLPAHRERQDPDYAHANRLARLGYYGARVEVFHHLPPRPLVEYDVASSYPWSMSQPLPWKWVGNVTGPLARKAYQRGVMGIYRARVRVPRDMRYPPLPYKPEEGAGLFFPTGTWEAWFASVELTYAESLGVEVQCLEGVTYETASPFAAYVEHLYSLKRSSTGAMRVFTKYLLNGSYGKFAERPERERLHVATSALAAEHLLFTRPNFRCVDDEVDPRILAEEYVRYARHAHFAVGATITAYSRMLLHRRMLEAVGLAYVDTDSLHCESWPGETGDALGQLKVELSGFMGRYYAPKLYSLHNLDGSYLWTDTPGGKVLQVACKGFPKGTETDFEALLASARAYRHWKEEGASEPLAKEIARSVGVETVRTRLLKSQLRPSSEGVKSYGRVLRVRSAKSWSGLSKKRRPLEGGDTLPWTVSELRAGKHRGAVSPALGL
jgi:hypothetical protein